MAKAYQRYPDFFVLGGISCGTSAVEKVCRDRPELTVRSLAQDFKIDRHFADVEQQLKYFTNIFSVRDPNKLCGAVMPHYLCLPDAARLIAAHAPDARHIVVLRSPVERTISHYRYNLCAGVEPHPLEVAIQQEERRCNCELERYRYGYLLQGRYAEYLEPFGELFGKDRIHVMFLSDLVEQFSAEIKHLFRFIGLVKTLDVELKQQSHWNSSAVTYRRRHFAKHPRLLRAAEPLMNLLERVSGGDTASFSARFRRRILDTLHPLPKIKPHSIEWLTEYFRPHDERLAEWLGRPLPWRE